MELSNDFGDITFETLSSINRSAYTIYQRDTLPISAPTGDFYQDMKRNDPVVLISGGVGLTPLTSILNTMIDDQPERKVFYYTCCKKWECSWGSEIMYEKTTWGAPTEDIHFEFFGSFGILDDE